MITAFIAAFGNAAEVLSTKIAFRERNISYRNFLAVSMSFIFLFTGFIFIFLGYVNPAFFEQKYILAFAGVILFAFLYNNLYFFALYKEKVCNVEPIIMLEPLVTVSLAAMIFPSERNYPALILTLVASLVLVISRIERHHLKFNIYLLAMLGNVFLMGGEAQLVKILLEVVSPVALYFFRTGILAVFFLLFLKPKLTCLTKGQVFQVAIIGLVTAIEYIARFYAISQIGIVQSSLIFLLGPVIILLSSRLLLKEKITVQKVIADIIIIMCVAAVNFIL